MTTTNAFQAERTENEVVIRVPTMSRLLRAFMPEEAVKHLQAAQREQLLAMRSIIDAAIERLEGDQPSRVRRTEIRVE
ncbi:MAG TPA: hypothetical protein VFA49_07740 [Chloroflexota bacterium]|jgi:hypothetical protein|nr:hypothetical protein [Chloroflexota bacterium]